MAKARSASARDVRETLDGIRRLVQSLRTGARRAGDASGLSAAELFMLHALADGGPAASLNALAERTFTDQSTASPVVERLRRRRMLRRMRAEETAQTAREPRAVGRGHPADRADERDLRRRRAAPERGAPRGGDADLDAPRSGAARRRRRSRSSARSAGCPRPTARGSRADCAASSARWAHAVRPRCSSRTLRAGAPGAAAASSLRPSRRANPR